MTPPQQPPIGGFAPGRIQLSLFIRDYLTSNSDSYAMQIYTAYKTAVLAQPKHRGKGPRKVSSYHSFLGHMFMLRQLGLISYLRDPAGEIESEEAENRPYLAPKHFLQAVPEKLSDIAWQNPHRALYG
ncbi:hypothetical protein LCGC14_1974440 [marine sediment metagenome]|uniref:Uncharacterized protein n=1 Tax=marine sediment metagenome TaxID=412755 RepID=A0A0F9FB54_9ZZZZ